jgi:hypothetical protein
VTIDKETSAVDVLILEMNDESRRLVCFGNHFGSVLVVVVLAETAASQTRKENIGRLLPNPQSKDLPILRECFAPLPEFDRPQ